MGGKGKYSIFWILSSAFWPIHSLLHFYQGHLTIGSQMEGKLISVYLDDGFGCADDYIYDTDMGHQVKNELILSGFISYFDKSIWLPMQNLKFEGLLLSLVWMKLKYILLSIKGYRCVEVRKVGQIISMFVVVGQVSQIMSRYLTFDILMASYKSSCISAKSVC